MWLQKYTIAEARPARTRELLRTSALSTPFFDFAPLWHDHSGHNIILVLNTLRRGHRPRRVLYSLYIIQLLNLLGKLARKLGGVEPEPYMASAA